MIFRALIISLMATLFWAADSFDEAAFKQKLTLETEAGKAVLLNATANEIKFSNPDKALELAIQAMSWAQKTSNFHEQAQALLYQSMAVKIRQDFSRALELNQRALAIAEKMADPTQVAQINSFMGLILSDLGELNASVEYTKKALDYYVQMGDEKRIAAMNNNLGARYYRMGDYSKSLEYHFSSLQAEERIGNKLGEANNLNMIGINYLALGEPDKARTYLDKARAAYEKLADLHGLAQVLNNLGIAWKDGHDLDRALSFYSRANKMALEIGHIVLQGETWLNIGEIYRLRQDYGRALAVYQQSLKLAEKTEDSNALSVCFLNIGEIHLLLGHDELAEKWLTDCLALAREKGYQELIQSSLRTLTDFHHRKGDDSRALANLEEWVTVREQMLNEQKNQAIAEMESKYRINQKDKELALLKRDQDVQQLQLSTTRQRLYIALLTALLALTSLFWLGKRYRRLFVFWKKKTYIGPYQVGERLGGGGFGDVYKAFSIRDANIPVALKLLREEYARDPQLRRRFLNEAKVIDQLDHPNIVKVLERGECNDRLYLAMEFIDGRTLAEIIVENPRLPIEFCVEVMGQLLDAVEALHRQGVLHRDLKPDNVMVLGGRTDSPQVKLMDFDLARDARMTPLTQTGELLGTLPYMPPERISGQVCSESGDLYSLGVLFYEMLTGEKPFPADTPVEVMKQVLDLDPLPVERLRKDIPDGIAKLISSLLSKEMAMRPNIEQIRLHLA